MHYVGIGTCIENAQCTIQIHFFKNCSAHFIKGYFPKDLKPIET